ncbi:MAG: TRAP transporter substrate-binding protein [Pseudomonadota bacterium]
MTRTAPLVGLAASIALITGAAADELPSTDINVVGNLGITTQSKTLEAPFWNETVGEATDGALKVRFAPWNEMGLKGPEVFRLLSNGVMNIATAQLGHHAGDAAINDATDLAGLSTSMDEFETVTNAFRPVLDGFYQDTLGLKILSLQSFQSQVLYCRGDLGGLDDLAGKKVRTSGASQADFVEHFGATAVNMSFGEVQQGLTQGVIDCAITGTLGGYTAGWHEPADSLFTLPINFGSGATVANLAWWNGLDPAVQTYLTEEIAKLESDMWALNREEDAMGIACNTSGPCPLGEPAGLTRVDPSDADVEKRREAMQAAVLPKWAERCGDDCVAKFNETVGPITGMTVN